MVSLKEEETMRALGPVVEVSPKEEETMCSLGPAPLLVSSSSFLFSRKHRRFFSPFLSLDRFVG
jgi:hypothetical protein